MNIKHIPAQSSPHNLRKIDLDLYNNKEEKILNKLAVTVNLANMLQSPLVWKLNKGIEKSHLF